MPVIVMNKAIVSKLKNIYSGFLRGLAGNPLPAIVFLFLVVLALGALIFYRYDILVGLSEPKAAGETIQFQEELYQQVLKEWQAREERFQAASSQNYINPFQSGIRVVAGSSSKKLSEERTQELLSNPQVQELLKAANLYQFYTAKGEVFLTIDERARIWQELALGQQGEYSGTYNQNIKLLSELKKELTK